VRHGCIYCAGAFEYDDRQGPLRDALLDGVRRWRTVLRRTVLQAIGERHLAAGTDADQLVFEMDALFTGAMRDARFLGDARALDRAWATWQRLIADRAVPSRTRQRAH
jgi:cytosine/adenosine deaminase-related metal-dependent hydrolase